MKSLPLVLWILFWVNCTVSSQELSQLKKQDSFSINGSLSSTVNYYNVTGKSAAQDPFTYLMTGNIDVSVYGFHLPFSFIYSGQNMSYAQPFNRFGISPQYKWLKVHLGYSNMNFSSFTLAGHSFLGVGIEMNPGKFRFAGAYGRFKQKTIPNSVNPLDTLFAPTRKGYSLKLGVGSQNNYFDLIFLNIADDSLSVDLSKGGKLKELQSNTVLGTHFRFRLAKSLSWETEGSLSLLTKNMANRTKYNIENQSLQKLVDAFGLNASSEYSTAFNSSLTFNSKLFSTGVQYRRISPNYQSFGAYYFNTDMENFTMNLKFSVFKRKLNLNGNVGLQRDNLNGNKASQSAKVISMANVNYNSGKVFSVNGSYSNYSINQQAGRLPLNDTIKLYQANRSITLMPMLTFNKGNLQQVVQLNGILTNVIDHNIFTAANSQITCKMAMLNYFINQSKLALSIMTGLNYTSMSSVQQDQTIYGVNSDIGKSLFKGKLNANLSISVNKSEFDNVPGWVNTGSFMFTFRPHKKHSFKFNIAHIMNNYPGNSSVKSYQITKSLFSYVYRI